MNDALLRLALIVISGITLSTGLAQLLFGDYILQKIATSNETSSVHLFQTVGMFMLITGAMFLQSLITRSNERSIPLWIAVQKFSAAILVVIAYQKGIFVTLTLGVAVFDALTGFLAFTFWRRMAKP